jgi:hypothetical protein
VQTEFTTPASNAVPRYSYVRRCHFNRQPLPLLQSALPPHEQERKPLCDYKKEGRKKERKKETLQPNMYYLPIFVVSCAASPLPRDATQHKVTTSSSAYNNRSVHICHGE